MCRRRLKALCALLLALSLGLGLVLNGAQASEMAVAGLTDIGAPAPCAGSADIHDMDEFSCAAMCMIAGAAVLQMLAVTKAKFGADSDFTSIARVVEEWAGVEIRD